MYSAVHVQQYNYVTFYTVSDNALIIYLLYIIL